ncbi:MAG TPA: hypothetical protein K8W21_01075 [Enorma massiliensis]|uniref:hypothetical protein n=1 Tax=Enorma massiliensis TaxID=1472761 RepID=UPI001DD9431D|nr:hypothetical protein [Enorma massiliensis]HJG61565.1 hypothetical protein [Enorma massiliensis]
MIVETLERQQRQDIKDFKSLSKRDTRRARELARERLISAGILDKSGNLAKPYRSE